MSQAAYINDSEAEASSSGGLLDFLKVGADIYRSSRNNTGVMPPVFRPGLPAPGLPAPVPWYKKPLVWAGAAALLLLGFLLVRRK